MARQESAGWPTFYHQSARRNLQLATTKRRRNFFLRERTGPGAVSLAFPIAGKARQRERCVYTYIYIYVNIYKYIYIYIYI